MEKKYGVRSAFGWCIFEVPKATTYPPPPLRKSGTKAEADKLRDQMAKLHSHVEYVIEEHEG